jgi:hypothetical protein
LPKVARGFETDGWAYGAIYRTSSERATARAGWLDWYDSLDHTAHSAENHPHPAREDEQPCRDQHLVIDDGSRLARVQGETGRLRDGAVQFTTCSSYAHHSNPAFRAHDYQGQIDYFAVPCSETAGVYLIPIADIPFRCEARLRVTATRNGQQHGIRYASEYEIGRVAVLAANNAESATTI